MRYTYDQTHIRSANQRVILDCIIQSDVISRASLSRRVHISKSSMTENISSLLETGIIHEVGTGSAKPTGGRKPILLQLNKEYAHIIAIDLNYSDPVFVIANLGGEIVNRFTVSVMPDAGYETRLELVKNAISTLLASISLQSCTHTVIAISSPGIYRPADGDFRINEQFGNWRIPELSKELGEAFHTKVLIVNDVNAAALGELRYGVGRGSRNLVYVSCGLGLGTGIVIDGKLYEGTWNSAGEVANFTVPCSQGCARLESLVNIDSLLARMEQAPAETQALVCRNTSKPTFKGILDAWRGGDPYVQEQIEDIATQLGYAISNIISLLNCDRVIWGGEYRVFQKDMLPTINRIVQESAFRPVEVVASELSQDSSIFGLFALASEEVFSALCGTGDRKLDADDESR